MGGYLCPQGYTTFRWVNNSSDELPSKLTEKNIKNGVLHVPYKDDVLLFDSTAIRQAQKNEELLVIPSANGKVACSIQNISISTYSDSTLEIHYSGYIFTKE